MKYLSLIAPLFLCATHVLHAMKKEKKHETIQALLAAPDLNINAHEEGTSSAIDLAIQRGDQNIVNLFLDYTRKEYNAACDEYIKKPNDAHQLIQKEVTLHNVLQYEKYKLLTHLLQQQMPQDLQTYITTIYHELNIETVIANKYKKIKKQYNHSTKKKKKRTTQKS